MERVTETAQRTDTATDAARVRHYVSVCNSGRCADRMSVDEYRMRLGLRLLTLAVCGVWTLPAPGAPACQDCERLRIGRRPCPSLH